MPFNLAGYTLTTTGLGGIVLNSGLDISNGTINVGNGAQGVTSNYNNTQTFDIQSSGSRQIITESSVTLNVTDATLRLQVNSGSVTYNATTNLNSNAVLNLISTNSAATNLMAINGPLNILGNTIIADTNAPNNGAAQSHPITINGNLTGSAALQVQVTTTGTTGAGIVLNGNDSAYTGAISLDAPSGNGTVSLISSTAGSAAATWNIAAGNTLRIAGVSVQLGTLNGAGTLTSNASGAVANIGSGLFSGNITAGSGLTFNQVGPGTLTINGTSNITPTFTNVTGGQLIINNSTINSPIFVAAGAVLSGNNSTLNNGVILNGTLIPGDAGTIGNIIVGSNSVFEWNGNSGSPMANFTLSNTDNTSAQLLITGTGSLTQNINTGSVYEFDFDDTGTDLTGTNIYTLITFGSTTFPSASDFSYTGLAPGLSGAFVLNPTSLQFDVTTAVPEPAVYGLLLGSLTLLAALRRKSATSAS
jgi:hypothetical protein